MAAAGSDISFVKSRKTEASGASGTVSMRCRKSVVREVMQPSGGAKFVVTSG